MIWNHVRKDLQRHRRQPLEFLIWLGIPLMVGALFTLLFGGSGGPQPMAHVLVVDEDDSFVSGLMLRALDGGGGEENAMPLRAESVDAAEGRRRIDAGEATALLTLPAGFGDAILAETPLALPLVTNPSQTILPRIVVEGLEIVADGHFYLHRLVGEDLKRFADLEEAPSDAEVADFSIRLKSLFERLGQSLDPPLLAVVAEPEPADAEPAESVPTSFLFLPSVLFMALLFMAQGFSGQIWEESQARTLPRILCAPGGSLPFLLGKLGTALLLFLAVGAVSLLIGALALGLVPSRLPAALLWIGLCGTALAAFFTALQLVASSQRAANILTMTLIFPLMMIGGSFFPFEAMPAGMARIGGMTPNGWSLIHLKRILLGRESAEALLFGAAILIAATALLTVFNTARLRARFGRAYMLKHLLYIARKDLRFTLRRRETWLWLFIMPIVFFYFIGTITSGGFGGISERANLVLWAEDAGPLGVQLEKRLDEQGFDVTRADSLHLFAAAKRRLALPAHFSDSLRAGRPVELVLGDDHEGLYNGYRGLQLKRAAYGLLADLIVTESGDSTALAALNAQPRALSVAVTSAGERLTPPSGFAQSVPGIMVMFTVLVLGTSGAIFLVEERRLGLLRRLAYAPVPRIGIMLGKWLSKLALGLVQIAFAMLAGTLIFKMDWGSNLPMVLLLMLSYGGVIAGLGILLGSISKSAGQAAAIGVVAANLLGALGGCWWPIEVTPPFMQKLALFLPTGWAMDGLHKLVSFGAAPASVLPHVIGMALLALLLIALTARVFRYE